MSTSNLNPAAAPRSSAIPGIVDRLQDLEALAQRVEPLERAWRDAWLCFVSGGHIALREVHSACAHLNAALEPMVDEVARITGAQPEALRRTFAPRTPTEVWFSSPPMFPSGWLRQVARHRSLNRHYWNLRERLAAEEAGEAVDPRAAPLEDASHAARIIEQGGAPLVARSVWQRSSSAQASQLEAALFRVGLIIPVRPADEVERLRAKDSTKTPRETAWALPCSFTSTRSIAYVAHRDSGCELVFWPSFAFNGSLTFHPWQPLRCEELEDSGLDLPAPRP